jgi:hypothetical protein
MKKVRGLKSELHHTRFKSNLSKLLKLRTDNKWRILYGRKMKLADWCCRVNSLEHIAFMVNSNSWRNFRDFFRWKTYSWSSWGFSRSWTFNSSKKLLLYLAIRFDFTITIFGSDVLRNRPIITQSAKISLLTTNNVKKITKRLHSNRLERLRAKSVNRVKWANLVSTVKAAYWIQEITSLCWWINRTLIWVPKLFSKDLGLLKKAR